MSEQGEVKQETITEVIEVLSVGELSHPIHQYNNSDNHHNHSSELDKPEGKEEEDEKEGFEENEYKRREKTENENQEDRKIEDNTDRAERKRKFEEERDRDEDPKKKKDTCFRCGGFLALLSLIQSFNSKEITFKGFGHYYLLCPSQPGSLENSRAQNCYLCNGRGHIQSRCPNNIPPDACYRCGMVGHRARSVLFQPILLII